MGLGSEIRDLEKTYSGSRIQGSKRHQMPDPDPQHWYFYSQLLVIENLDPDPYSDPDSMNPDSQH